MATPSLFERLWKWARKSRHYPYVSYQLIALFGRKKSTWRFMNYGFEALDGTRPALDPRDERERVSVQLYHFVASGADLTGKDILEVGSGRGGGSEFMHRHFGARSTTGMDFSGIAVRFCQDTYQAPGLSYKTGNAMDLPFPDASFDVVVNVESAHLYPDPDKFLAEVFRVLRPGGAFLYTDILSQEIYAPVRDRLKKAGFVVRAERDISPEVLHSLDVDSDRRKGLIRLWAPPAFQSFGGLFAGVTGSYTHEKLRSGRSRYFSFVAIKAAQVAAVILAAA